MKTEVTALVITSGETPYLAATLMALGRQSLAPDAVCVIDVSQSGVAHRHGTKVLSTPGAANLGQAIEMARRLPDFPTPAAGSAVWILHDDCAADSECLAELVKCFESSDSIKIVGAKQRGWDRANQILELGIQATGSGRRLQEADAGEIDQGQYDYRDDILAAGTAGMLLDWDLFRELEGFDPALGPYGDGLEYSRRVRLAGYRVVAAPKAIVYHKMAGYYGLRGLDGGRPSRTLRLLPGATNSQGALAANPKRSYGARRYAQLHNWMVAAPWWQFIFLPLFIVLLGLARFVWHLVNKEPQLAAAEMKSTLLAVLRPLPVYRARLVRSRHAKVSARVLRPLQIKTSRIWQVKLTQRRVARDKRRPQIADAVAQNNYRREKIRNHLVSWVFAVIVAGIALLGWRFALTGVMGGALPNLPSQSRGFWTNLISGWVPSGLGYGSQVGGADALGIILAALGQVLLNLNLAGSLVLAILLFLTMPLAFLAAWWACGVVTTSRPLRALVALSWALSPNLLVGLAQGQIPVWILAIFIPLFVGSLARASGMGVRYTVMGELKPLTITVYSPAIIQSGIAALSAFLVVGASHALVLPVFILTLLALFGVVKNQTEEETGAGLETRRRLKVPHGLITLFPAGLLVLPTLVRSVTHPALAGLWVSSLSVPHFTPSPGWLNLALGWPLDLAELSLPIAFPLWQILAFLPFILLIITIFVGLLIPGKSLAPHIAALLASLGLVLAGLAALTPSAISESVPIAAWPGPGLAVYHAGLISAGLFSVSRLRLTIPNEVATWGERNLRKLVALALTVPVIGGGPLLANQFTAPAHSDFNAVQPFSVASLPASVAQGQSSSRQLRALRLSAHPAPGQSILVEATLWRDWGQTTFEASPYVKLRNLLVATGKSRPDAADRALANTVAALRGGDTPNIGEKLAQLDVNYVIVAPGTDSFTAALVNSMDAITSLQRVTTTEAGTVWRLRPSERASLVRVARGVWKAGKPSWSDRDTNAKMLPLRRNQAQVPAGVSGRLVAIAERADAHFTVKFNSEILEPVENSKWNAVYKLPDKAGILQVSYGYLPQQVWGGAVLLSLLIAVAAALPLRRVTEVSQ